ncbi:TPA: hypothetical protein ACOBTX_002744 [Enterococcus faecium]
MKEEVIPIYKSISKQVFEVIPKDSNAVNVHDLVTKSLVET